MYDQKNKDTMDRYKIEEELRKCGLEQFENRVRELAYIWLEKKASTTFYNELFMYMLDCGIYGKEGNGVWGKLAERGANEKDVFVQYYFPRMEYMREMYPYLRKYPFLLPVMWGVRAVHGLKTGAFKRNEALTKESTEHIEKMLWIYRTLKLDFKK